MEKFQGFQLIVSWNQRLLRKKYLCPQITQFDKILSLEGYNDIKINFRYILILRRMESDYSYILQLFFQINKNLKIHILKF
jgi:hypothetical protein